MAPIGIVVIASPQHPQGGHRLSQGWLHRQDVYQGYILTACSIALQCGIFTLGGVIMEGLVFINTLPLSDKIYPLP